MKILLSLLGVLSFALASRIEANGVLCKVQDYVYQGSKLVKSGAVRKVRAAFEDGAGWAYAKGASKVSPSVTFEGSAYGGRTSSFTEVYDSETDQIYHEQVTVSDDGGTAEERAARDGRIYYVFKGARKNGSPGAIDVDCGRDDF